MRCWVLLLGLSMGGVPSVQAEGGLVSWVRLDVATRLGNDGRAEVSETHEIKIQGDVSALTRSFNYAADQGVAVRGVFRLDALGSRRALRAAAEGPDSYQVYWWGVQFSPKGEGEAPFEGVATKRFVIEFTLEGALTPAWDLAAGPLPLDEGTTPRSPLARLSEVWAGWREAWPDLDRHYRFDHDVVFPSRGAPEGLAELNYRFEYGTAFVLVDKDREIGVATPDVGYRVQRVLRYLPAGRPQEVDVEPAAFRIAALLGPLFTGLLAGALFLLTDRLSNPSPRGGRVLFETVAAPLAKELLALRMGRTASPPSFEAFLLRMAAQKRLAITVERPATDETDALVTLRLTTDRAKLPAVEQKVVQELFGPGDRVSTADIQVRFRGREFDPDGLVDAAFESHRVPTIATSRPGWSALHLAIMAGGLAFMVKSLLDRTLADPLPLLGGLVPGGIVAALWATGSGRNRPGLRLILSAILVLGGLGAALALSPNTPLGGMAALGLTLLSAGHCVGFLARLPRVSESDLELQAARTWALDELRRPRPDLRDAWVDAIEGLGGGRALARWRERYAGALTGAEDMAGMEPSEQPAGPPFTGEAPRPPALAPGWASGFSVYGQDEDEDEDEDEDDEGAISRARGGE